MSGMFRQFLLFWRAANAQCKSHSKMASMRRDHALEPGEQVGHRVHLVMCRGCRRYSEQMNQVSSLMQPAPGDSAKVPNAMPPDVRERLKAKLGS